MNGMALVTGANSMLGVAIVRKLIANGMPVIAHYHVASARIDSVVKEYPSMVKGIVRAELDEEGIAAILKAVESERIGLLVNNAATIVVETPAANLDWRILGKTFEVNAIAPAILALALFEKMKSTGGRIINISSISARYGGGDTTLHYGMSKAALDALTANLARRGAKYNILVNSIRPGVIDTDFHSKNTPNKDMKKRIEMIPLRRMVSPEEVAAMVAFLASPSGDSITGETISIAGGD